MISLTEFIALVLLAAAAVSCSMLFFRWSWRLDATVHPLRRVARLLAWMPLLLLFLWTAFLWNQARATGQRQRKVQLASEAKMIEETVHTRLQKYQDLARGSAQFVATQRLDPALWQRYVSSLNLPSLYPHVRGLGWAAYVPQEKLPRFLSAARRGGATWTVSPPGERYDYFVVQAVEPLADNKGVLGYDLGSELSARTAAERARESAGAALTGRLLLLDDPGNRSFLLFWPVLSPPAGTIQGWTFLRFRQDDLLQGLGFDPQALPFAFALYDGAVPSKEALMLQSKEPVSAQAEPYVLELAGRAWLLKASLPEALTAPSTETHARETRAWLMLALCFGAAGILGIFVGSLRRAEQLAYEKSSLWREKEKALVAGPFGLMICDATQPDLPLVYVNPRFERLTGYSANEVLGRNPRFLLAEDPNQKPVEDIRRALRDQFELKTLVRNYKKDGSPFWNELTLTPIRNDQGKLIQWAGVLNDVTEREQAERRLSTQIAVIRALAEAPDVEQASQNILQVICESQGWDLGTLWRVDPRGNVLRCMEVWHQPDLNPEEFERFVRDTTYPKDMGLPGTVWSRGEALWFFDVRKEAQFPEASLIAKQGLTGACGFPIAGAHGIIGVMAFYSKRLWPLNKNLMLLMAGTASQISRGFQSQQALLQEKELNVLERGLAEFLGEGLLAMNKEGVCIYANASAGKMLGLAPVQLLGESLRETLQPDRNSPLEAALQQTMPLHYTRGQEFRRADGSWIPVALTTSPIVDQGMIQGVVVTFLDTPDRGGMDDADWKARWAAQESRIHELEDALREAQQSHPSEQLLGKIRDLLKDIT